MAIDRSVCLVEELFPEEETPATVEELPVAIDGIQT